jgi:hypothetical protein
MLKMALYIFDPASSRWEIYYFIFHHSAKPTGAASAKTDAEWTLPITQHPIAAEQRTVPLPIMKVILM